VLRHFIEAAGDNRVGIIENQIFNIMIIKRYLSFAFLIVLMAIALVAEAQRKSEISSKTKIIDGKEYYIHRVMRGETLSGLSSAYKVSIGEIENLNPRVKDGLKADDVIKIPVKVRKQADPIPVVIEPKPEPITEEPKQEPVAVKVEIQLEPIQEPIVEPKVTASEPEAENIKTEIVASAPMEMDTIEVGGYYVVQHGEDLYDIAKKFAIDIADFKAVNPGLDNNPPAETMIKVPNIVNEKDYIIHKVEYNERATSMLKRWKVKEKKFREKNISVGSHVFVNQIVLIPIEPVVVRPELIEMEKQQEEQIEEQEEEVEVEEQLLVDDNEMENLFFDEIPDDLPECQALPENALRRYKVALMVPLYLQELEGISMSKEKAAQSQSSRPLTFLQFYEGFMMAAEKLEEENDMRLDLTVMDVTDNVSTAYHALSQIEGKDFDLIVGPFFGKSFSVIEEYAKARNIPVVNPLSTRASILEDNPNVIKVKPDKIGQIITVSNLVKNYYPNSNVFLISRESSSDSVFLNQLEHHLNLAVNEEVKVSGDEFIQFARKESERLEMGSRMVPTVDVEGQVYSTNDFQDGSIQNVVFENAVKRYEFTPENIEKIYKKLSGVRNNLIIACGDDNVFATQILNSFAKDTDRYPITLVAVPDWAKYEKLLVDNLLKMNTIYVNDFFVDYGNEAVKRFVIDFRRKYVCEPQNYAFEGYDVAWYFLNALMRYGDHLMDCLHCYDMPLLHTRFRFSYNDYLKSGGSFGKENFYWGAYQYDNESIMLKPIDSFKKVAE
jgi:LysM repeat protein